MIKALVCCALIAIFGVKTFAEVNPDEKKMMILKQLSLIGRQQTALASLQIQLDHAEDLRDGHFLVGASAVTIFLGLASIVPVFGEPSFTKKALNNVLWAFTGVAVYVEGKQFIMYDAPTVRHFKREIERAQDELNQARETYSALRKD